MDAPYVDFDPWRPGEYGPIDFPLGPVSLRQKLAAGVYVARASANLIHEAASHWGMYEHVKQIGRNAAIVSAAAVSAKLLASKKPATDVPTSVMAYGRRGASRPLRPVQLGTMRGRARRRGRRPRARKTFSKRVKRVIDSVSENKFVIAPTVNTSPLIDDAQFALGAYEFSTNYPLFPFIRLGLPDHLPSRLGGVGAVTTPGFHATNFFTGRKVDITGYTISGTIFANQSAHAHGYLRMHLVKWNTDKWPLGLDEGTIGTINTRNGSGTVYDANLLNLRAGYMNPIVSDAAPTSSSVAIPIGEGTVRMFDRNDGDRHPDISGRRIGIFNHGFKLHPGFTVVKSVTLDARTALSASTVNDNTYAFKTFVPMKASFNDLGQTNWDAVTGEPTTLQIREQMMRKIPILFVIFEPVQILVGDYGITPGNSTTPPTVVKTAGTNVDPFVGYTIRVAPPRLHFKDHA